MSSLFPLFRIKCKTTQLPSNVIFFIYIFVFSFKEHIFFFDFKRSKGHCSSLWSKLSTSSATANNGKLVQVKFVERVVKSSRVQGARETEQLSNIMSAFPAFFYDFVVPALDNVVKLLHSYAWIGESTHIVKLPGLVKHCHFEISGSFGLYIIRVLFVSFFFYSRMRSSCPLAKVWAWN